MLLTGCNDGDIRLQGGRASYDGVEGRVEMCRNNVWGIVCHNSWGPADAAVVCHELGLPRIGKQCIIIVYLDMYHNRPTIYLSITLLAHRVIKRTWIISAEFLLSS